MKILGISGRKQSGKSTSAEFLVDEFSKRHLDVHIISFADRLKEIFLELFVPEELNLTSKMLSNDLHKLHLLPTTGGTVREGLQQFGSNMCREYYGDVWVEAVRVKLRQLAMSNYIANIESPLRVIIPDVRFKNELKFIQELDGHVVRLLRAPFEDSHKSEQDLNDVELVTLQDCLCTDRERLTKFNATIDNRKMDIETKNKALWNLVKGNEWL
ncbi:hypothetical protein LCGC14_3053350 [marine sediment metagenome]|uniref:Dephospho-CoA kinase n=1 Tax=marine sediment metagenome TaxID=412755 RepID=A0A0F8WLH9_9ZZZZ